MSDPARALEYAHAEFISMNTSSLFNQAYSNDVDALHSVWYDNADNTALAASMDVYQIDAHPDNMPGLAPKAGQWRTPFDSEYQRVGCYAGPANDFLPIVDKVTIRGTRSDLSVIFAPCALCGQQQRNESEARYGN